MAGFSNDIVYGEAGLDIGAFPNTTSSLGSIEFSRSGSIVTLICYNTSDDALSDARMKILVNSITSGFPYLQYTVGSDISWSYGIDPSDLTMRLNRDTTSNVSPGTGTNMFFIGSFTARYNVRLFIVSNDHPPKFVEHQIKNTDTTNNAAAGVRALLSTSSNLADVYHYLNIPQASAPGDQTWELGLKESTGGRIEWRTPINAALPELAGTIRLAMTTDGELTLPTNPAFLAKLSATDVGVTGDGTIFQIGSANVMTIIYNKGSHFTVAGVFTASVDGTYLFCGTCDAGNITSAYTGAVCTLIASNRSMNANRLDPGNVFDTVNRVGFQITQHMDMDAGDTCTFNLRISGSTLSANVLGDAVSTYFSGDLVG